MRGKYFVLCVSECNICGRASRRPSPRSLWFLTHDMKEESDDRLSPRALHNQRLLHPIHGRGLRQSRRL